MAEEIYSKWQAKVSKLGENTDVGNLQFPLEFGGKINEEKAKKALDEGFIPNPDTNFAITSPQSLSNSNFDEKMNKFYGQGNWRLIPLQYKESDGVMATGDQTALGAVVFIKPK